MGNILLRIQEIACKEGITIGALERAIGASKGVLSRAISNGTDIQSKWIGILVVNYPHYSTRWLLTGEGSMLRKASPLANELVLAPSDAVTLRLMDKLDQKDAENKHLQSELRAKSEELAVLKAQYAQSDAVPLAFTPGSPEAYTESCSRTKKDTVSSGRLLGGKI